MSHLCEAFSTLTDGHEAQGKKGASERRCLLSGEEERRRFIRLTSVQAGAGSTREEQENSTKADVGALLENAADRL